MIIRPPVIKRLFAQSGNQCAFPTCRPPSWKVKPSWARFATSRARAHTAPAMTPARPTNSRSWETVPRTSSLGFRVTREINSIEANGVDQFAFMWQHIRIAISPVHALKLVANEFHTRLFAVDLRRGNFASSGSITETAALSFYRGGSIKPPRRFGMSRLGVSGKPGVRRVTQ